MKHPLIKYTLVIVLTVGALYLAARGVKFEELWSAMKDASLMIIILGVVVMFMSHYVRSWRWKMFLRPMKDPTRVSSAFRALIAAYGVNKVIPRSGDIVRPLVYWKREGVPLSGTIASILIERLSDLIGLSLVLSIVFMLFLPDIQAGLPELGNAAFLIMSVCTAAFIFGVLILFSEDKTLKVVHFLTKRLPEKFRLMVERAAYSFAKGLHHARTGMVLPLIIGTLGIWLLYAASLYVSLFAFDDPQLLAVGIKGCILLQALSALAFLIPTPGGIGPYHAAISGALTSIFGVSPDVAMAYATLTHAANYIITAVVGIGFVLAEGVSLGDLSNATKGKATEDMKKAGVKVDEIDTKIAGEQII
ncbi:MAG TPA: lysylphosphatidylglycerol synthase transmembrane domain-containing protein [Candidatus Kapabacteria bacterium]|nr:lysylphosphatidylglycerol synthase transmembrane domain-containing protein [Candidatus Kapabacteria bacterium]